MSAPVPQLEPDLFEQLTAEHVTALDAHAAARAAYSAALGGRAAAGLIGGTPNRLHARISDAETVHDLARALGAHPRPTGHLHDWQGPRRVLVLAHSVQRLDVYGAARTGDVVLMPEEQAARLVGIAAVRDV